MGLAGAIALLAGTLLVGPASADEDEDLAMQLSNPVANLISVPFQANYDDGIGPRDDGRRLQTNIQPVIPITLDPEWNVISRTIAPVVWQKDVVPGAGEQFGLGDVVQSLFLSPQRPTAGGLIWGAGPVFLVPTATDERIGAEKWGAGPTAVGLVQRGHWTAGVLANHIWSFAGEADRPDVDLTFMQPFLSYTTADAVTYSLTSESSYNWTGEHWAVPVNATISKIIRLGPLPVQVGGGLRYWADPAPNGPDGLGVRFQLTFLLPR